VVTPFLGLEYPNELELRLVAKIERGYNKVEIPSVAQCCTLSLHLVLIALMKTVSQREVSLICAGTLDMSLKVGSHLGGL
jgi:hypothetical protein